MVPFGCRSTGVLTAVLLFAATAHAQRVVEARSAFSLAAPVAPVQVAPPIPTTVLPRVGAGLVGGFIAMELAGMASESAEMPAFIAGTMLGVAVPRGGRPCSFSRRLVRSAAGTLIGAPVTIIAHRDQPSNERPEHVALWLAAYAIPAFIATVALEQAC